VHPTGGTLRVFKPFAWLEVGSVKMALSRPAHQRVTPAVWAAYTYLCENIPELVISAKSCILKSYNGGIKNGFLRAYRYLVGQERADIDG